MHEFSEKDREIIARVRPRFEEQLSRSGHAAAVMEMATSLSQRTAAENLMRDMIAPYQMALGRAGLSGEALDSLRDSVNEWIRKADPFADVPYDEIPAG